MDKIKTFMIDQNKRLVGIALTAVLLLFIPLIAMQFINEINWTVLDFIVAAILLLVTGLICGLVIRKTNKIKYRIAICIVLLTALFLIWAELAVGILGTPFGGQ